MTVRWVVAHILSVLLAFGILLPTAAFAERGHAGPAPRQMPHRPGRVVSGPGHGQEHGQGPGPVPNRFAHHRVRPFPSYGYSVPYYYGGYGLPYAYDTRDYDQPAPAPSYQTVYVAPPAAPTGPRVVEFSTGRYELRGDGVSSAYRWVWIPNPPAAPDAPPEPPAAPAVAPAPPTVTAEAPSRPSRLYRWVDADGVVHLTDNPSLVPVQFRKPVVRN